MDSFIGRPAVVAQSRHGLRRGDRRIGETGICAVAFDSLITNPAGDYDPSDLNSPSSCLLRVHRTSPRPHDRPTAPGSSGVEGDDGCSLDRGTEGIIMAPGWFRDASWDGAALVIGVGAFRRRVVRFVRPGERPINEPEV